MTNFPMDINEVLKYLPHRPPFLFVDRVLSFEKGKDLVAIKNVTINEAHFQGHFPQFPVMPGVLILESLAQAATVFAFLSTGEDPNKAPYLFTGIEKAKFRRMVVPGDQLRLEINLIKHRHSVWVIEATAKVDDEVACVATLKSIKGKAEDDS